MLPAFTFTVYRANILSLSLSSYVKNDECGVIIIHCCVIYTSMSVITYIVPSLSYCTFLFEAIATRYRMCTLASPY